MPIARIASILNLAAERGLDFDEGDVSLLNDPNELNLIRTMLRFPELIDLMAKNLESHHLPHYAMELATAFHWFYENCRVVSSNPGGPAINAGEAEVGGCGEDYFAAGPGSHGNERPRTNVIPRAV